MILPGNEDRLAVKVPRHPIMVLTNSNVDHIMDLCAYKVVKNLPQSMKDWYFDFNWDQAKLWALNAPLTVMATEELVHQLDYTIWPDSHGNLWRLSPREVMNNPGAHPAHEEKIARADTDYPIILMRYKGRLTIMDGFHRLTKCVISSAANIRVKIVQDSAIPEIARET